MSSAKEILHQQISKRITELETWFEKKKSNGLQLPFYSSFDIRDSGFKVAPVDANLFPAGFNNICPVDKENAVDLVGEYLANHYELPNKKILLITEEHTQNAYYWDNVHTLCSFIKDAGYEVKVSFPNNLEVGVSIKSASGQEVMVEPTEKRDGRLYIGEWTPDLVINNNDFSSEREYWAEGLTLPINPPREMGWYRRKKSRFFEAYNKLALEFAEILEIDPWMVQVRSESFQDFEVDNVESRKRLAEQCALVVEGLKEDYGKRDIAQEPFLFVKNDSGTYGLGVIQVAKPEDVEAWTYKARKKMKAAKGGGGISQVLIQEGVPTQVKGEEGQVAEPAIYMVGCELAGGFLRTHTEKSATESLNSPGAVYQKLCVSDLKVKLEGCPLENAYGWIAKLAFLAVAEETRAADVNLVGYKP